MPRDLLVDDVPSRRLVLDLCTEIAILEHLIRKRLEPLQLHGLSAPQFGVVNYFLRLGRAEEKLSTLAWCFQVEEDAMRMTVAFLVSEDWLSWDAASDPCVRATATGRRRYDQAIDGLAPEIIPLLQDFDIDELRVTTRTLTELRRTLDNLPDR